MIRFEINGEYLDLPADFSLQFKKSNILFAFENIECQRSTSFDIPATTKNDRIFSLAKWVQSDGVGMRRKYEAQMQDGLIVQNGFLHVDAYSSGKYKAVFVTGELLGLKQIRDAGKIKDFWKPAGGIVWSTANIKDANDVLGNPFAIVRYVSNVALLHPSFDLSDVCAYAYNELTGKAFPPRRQIYRLIPKEVEGMGKTDLKLKYQGTEADFSTTPETASFANTIVQTGAMSAIGTTTDTVLFVGVGGTTTQERYIKVRQWVANQTIILSFPSSFPDDMFLMSIQDHGGGGEDPEYNPISDGWFLGGWRFYPKTGGGTATDGTPLAGRSVTIPRGTRFVILSSNDYEYQPSPFNWDGFRYIAYENYEFELIAEADELQEGDTVRAYDLLPDLTLTDLLKMYAALEGKMLYYENDNLQFDTLDISTWNTFDLTGRVISVSNIARKFGNYAQRNVIDFKSGSDVMPSHRVSNAYTIDNDNIEEEKSLLRIPYSEGEIAERNGFIVARFDAEDTEKNVLYEQGIMYAKSRSTSGSTYGERITIPKNAGLQALCDASTSVEIRARISYLEYEQIKPKTLLYYDGVKYVWTESNWSKSVATLKLSKIIA